jgi:hypothetical protein
LTEQVNKENRLMISRIDLNFIEYAFDELIKNTSFESKIKDLKIENMVEI